MGHWYVWRDSPLWVVRMVALQKRLDDDFDNSDETYRDLIESAIIERNLRKKKMFKA